MLRGGKRKGGNRENTRPGNLRGNFVQRKNTSLNLKNQAKGQKGYAISKKVVREALLRGLT